MNLDLVGFLAVVMIAYVIPGPDFFVILQSAVNGKRVGIWTAVGAQSGLAVHMLLAVIGLTSLVAQSATAFAFIKAAGALYLMWMGGRLVWSSRSSAARSRTIETSHDDTATGRWAGFRRGLLTNVLNPKAALFFLSVLPQFIDLGSPAAPQILLLGVIDIAVGLVWWAAILLVMRRLASLLRRPRIHTWWDRITGSVLAGVGGTLMYATATSKTP